MTTMATNVRNYFKLEQLLARSYVTLRQLFKNRYFLFTGGQVWDDSPTCGSNYRTNVISKNKKLTLTPVQKTSIANGNSNEWDLTTLTALLLNTDRPKTLHPTQVQQLDSEDKLFRQLREIRNKLAHHGSKSIADSEFSQLWMELSTILLAFGETSDELDKLKDDSVFESSKQTIKEENVKEALRLNSLGTQAHKDGKFADALSSFTKATVLPGVSNYDRAVFYSNMSSSRLALYERQVGASRMCDTADPADQRYRALQDAKQARNLWSTWWKAHFRVGKAYAVLDEHEKAINSFERALALAPTDNKIQKALYESRQTHSRQLRREYLDRTLQPKTIPEHLNELQEKLGLDPQEIRNTHSSLEKACPSVADVVKGHQYEHGDIDIKQDYEQAAKYFAKAASQGNAEGMYNLARLTDCGFGVKKDHVMALALYKQAAAQTPQHPLCENFPNVGVAESEHTLGLRYADGIGVHKNLPTAAYWYRRAVDHGSIQSANNLAIMFLNGTGVDKDLHKAEQLLELSARGGSSQAMLTLAAHLATKNDFQMAKIWYDRACETGDILANVNRNAFEKDLQKKQRSLDHCLPKAVQLINETRDVYQSLKPAKSVYKLSDQSKLYDYDVLSEYALRGSITAKNMCDALEHFRRALVLLLETKTLTETEENVFIHELAQCYRIEHIVAQIPGIEMREKTGNIVDRVLQRCSTETNTTVSLLDEDARTCYAVLHMDSHKLVVCFLNTCIQKYPKSIHFLELRASVYAFLQQFERTLYDTNLGLEIDPTYCELLYYRGAALRMIETDVNEAVRAYRTFLATAPKDHRKVPESYYAMASCYLMRDSGKGITDILQKTYHEGEEAEKLQLPCFLPYQSNSKAVLKHLLDARSLFNTEPSSSFNPKLRLTKPHRVEVIKQHRDWEGKASQLEKDQKHALVNYTWKARDKQQTSKTLVGLKSIALKEMNPTKDHVYNKHVLAVKIIDEALTWSPSIHLVVEDENLDCERLFIYNYPDGQGKYLISEVFTIGSKMSIINPYLRLGANDMKPLIRVDDFSSIMMQSEFERVLNVCRCCGEPNAPHVCSKCQRARYCSKECQTMDWKLYEHKSICNRH